jgi:hypothetical protein
LPSTFCAQRSTVMCCHAKRDVVRVLLTGWFSFDTAEVTAGDLMAKETVHRWLTEGQVDHEVAMAANFRTEHDVDWSTTERSRFSHVVFVCGPAAGELIAQLFERFSHTRRIFVGVSVVGGTDALAPDVMIERDSARRVAPDLALGTQTDRVPVVAVVRSHPQPEYGARQRHGDAHRAIDALLLASDVAPVTVDTRLHPYEAHLCGTSGQLESALARVDVVVTTRLHGLVLGLKNGVPVLAVDPIASGGKVAGQAQALDWPAIVNVEDADPDRLRGLLAWCLTPEGNLRAARCVEAANDALCLTRDRLLDALQTPGLEG